MMINIENVVYHVLNKERDAVNNGTIEINPNELPIDASTKELFSQLMERYRGKAGKGYGTFESDTINFPASSILGDFYNNNDFLLTTNQLMTVLLNESNRHAFTTGGKVVFVKYSENQEDYFLVAILSEKIGLLAQNWNLTQDEFLNFENLKFAGRVNLTKWQNNSPERYISFIKGRGDVSDYFKRFLGCNDVLMNSDETKKLVTQIENFSDTQQLDFNTRTQLLESCNGYLVELSENSEQFNLETFANRIWSSNPQELVDCFEDYGQQNNLEISDGFVPDKRNLKRLITYEQKTTNWKLSFGASAISSGDIELSDSGQIIINNPNQTLVSAFGTEDN